MKEDQKQVHDLFSQMISLRAYSFEIQPNNGFVINFSQTVASKSKDEEESSWYFWFYTETWQLDLNDRILTKNNDTPEKIQSELEKLKGKKLIEVDVPDDKYDVKMRFEDGLVFHMMAEDYINCRIPIKVQKIEIES